MGDLRGRLIAFDLDGTLVDSRRDLADAANALVLELGGTPLAEEAVGRMVGEGARVLVERALAGAGLRDRAADPRFIREALARFLVLYDDRLLAHTAPYPGIVDAVTALRPRARTAVLTNKPTPSTERLLEGLGLRALFDDVVGGDGPYPRKPDPASLLHLMARHRVPAAGTVLVGDSRIDFETARAAGTAVCLARYGFGYEQFPLDHLTGAEEVVDDPAEIPGAIERLFARSPRA